MSIFTKLGADIAAPTDAAGAPRKVVNGEFQTWMTEVERLIQIATGNGDLLLFNSKDDLDSSLNHPANTGALLIGESIADDGLYMKQGASGAGSWVKIGGVPGQGFVKATNTGTGTSTAIEASTPVAVNETQLILLPIAAENAGSPVTVSFNGGSPLTIKTVSGSDVAAGGLPASSVMLGTIQGSTFRLLSDQASAAIQAAAEAARDEAVAVMTTVIDPQFTNKSTAEVFSPSVAPDYIRLAGYATAGDGRGFLAVKTASDPGHDAAFKITLADGITEQWYVAGDVKKKVAYILFTGQSNASQPFANGSPADQIHPQAKIWDGSGWSTIGPNVGSPRPMASDATTHSLYNFTRRLIEEGGFVECRVIKVSYGGRPISDWVGTPGNRTIDATNTPRMQEIKDAFNASGADKFTHVVMIQGEADAGKTMFPFSEPGTYGHEREYFRQSLVNQGMADDENTRWFEVELLRREVSSDSWRANRAITQLDQTGRGNVAVVSSAGFVGEDEGLTVTLMGTPIPYTLHFKSEENSELGNRLYEAARKFDTDAPATVQMDQQETNTPLGAPGTIIPFHTLHPGGTYSLSSQWARGSIINLSAGETYNITLLADDLRTGYAPAAGKSIRFKLSTETVLNLTTELFDIYDSTGGNRPFSSSMSRKGALYSSKFIELLFTGLRWELVEDLSYRAISANFRWRFHGGLLEAAGVHAVGLAAGSVTTVTFPPEMPPLRDTGYQVTAEAGCMSYNKSTAGFDLYRQTTANGGTNVNWSLKFGELASL